MLNIRRRLLSILLILLSTTQSVVATADCCAPDLSNDSVGYDLAIDTENAFDKADPTIEQNVTNTSNHPFTDNCVECSHCLCCAHFALPSVDIETLFHASYTVFSDYAPPGITSTYSPLLHPPKA